MECSVSGCIRPIYSKGLCHKHYDADRLARAPKCTAPGCDAPQWAGGFCGPHYRAALRREGPRCSVEGCERGAVSRGLCDSHRKRRDRQGAIDPTRAADWGGRTTHPLYDSWMWLRRQAGRVPTAESWIADFWTFAREIGDRPSPRHVLRRKNRAAPHGPDNSYWASSDMPAVRAESRKEYMRRYFKQYREAKPEIFRAYELKRRRGIAASEYDRMMAEQDGKCAICGKPETAIHHRTGEPRALAVDHCHTSGKVRGLLCTGCNAVLGYAKDSIPTLEAAIRYLKRHHSPP
jgi:hypothetical protein